MMNIVLAGQPNCGKSTIFNMLSGLRQHIANYPGVTVDKKSGRFSYEGEKVNLVDLPGTYSFSAFSLEEKVVKDVMIQENIDVVVNVVDASNLKRNFYLTFQLLEMGKPTVVVLNMIDIAEKREIKIDIDKISKSLGCPVVAVNAAKGIGKEELLKTIFALYKNKDVYRDFAINYGTIEIALNEIEKHIADAELQNQISPRWLAIKALEEDKVIMEFLQKLIPDIHEFVENQRKLLKGKIDIGIESILAHVRYESCDIVYADGVNEERKPKKTFTEKADAFVLNRWLAFPFLFFVIFAIYELSIVYGYELTNYTWPYLAAVKIFIMDLLPQANLTDVPIITDFGNWMVNSVNALLNYVPIFLILFALIAIMEDVGYMPRMAFILDRVFKKFGLHGQSTLPYVLSGAFVGGCAVPGVMSTKGIADEKARLATIITAPLMNCLAKVPFYTLLLGAFFPEHMGTMMFYISTITIFTALIISKFITGTFLRTRASAPFVMELPPYHLPTFKGVVFRAFERVWLYLKKVATIVLAVAVVLFVMLQFPGLSSEREEYYAEQTQKMLEKFDKKVKKIADYEKIDEREEVAQLLNFYDAYRSKKMVATTKEAGMAIDAEFEAANAELFKFLKPKSKDARLVSKSLRKLSKDRNKILRGVKDEKVENSLLGMAGKALVPITQFAGFDWKINVAFLSSFAARESAVATLGSLYQNNKIDNEEEQRAEEAMAQSSGYTSLHAAAFIIFMLLTPPCIATMIVVKMQTNSYKWMLFAMFFPMGLGILGATVVFSSGELLGWNGFEAMSIYYFSILALAIILGLLPQRRINWQGGIPNSKLAK